jgi:hypothetical protein
MAFCNKIGNLLRQGATQTSQAPVSSMLNYLRHMSSSKLFVGGITLVGIYLLLWLYIIIFCTTDESYGDVFCYHRSFLWS